MTKPRFPQATAARALRDITSHSWQTCDHADPRDCLRWARDLAARALGEGA